MTTEEKAKAYEMALEAARKELGVDRKEWEVVEHVLHNIFPELRESEDERIRKWLADYFSSIKKTVWIHRDITCEQILEWLEKQKEPTTEELYAEAGTTEKEYIANTMKMVRAMRETKKEQKPDWSEEDADMLNCCISSIEEAKENRYAYNETDGDTSYDREIDWLKSLRPSWKPSDQDELMKLKYAGTSTKLD